MNILIADDSPTNLKLLRAILEGEGHRVYEANDGVQALMTLQVEKIDAIVSDIFMPNMDGYRLCFEVRRSELLKHIPFIAYTSTYTSAADEKLCLDLGCDAYLRKPAPSDLLIAALNEAVAGPRREPKIALQTDDVLKEYSQRLVDKLEERNHTLNLRTEELRRTHEQLRHMLAHSPAVLYTLRVEGVRLVPVVVSENIERLLGVTPLEATHEWWLDAIHPDDSEVVSMAAARTIEENGFAMEYRLRHRDGTYRWVQDNNRVVRGGLGHATEVIGVWINVTERRNLQQQLFQSQKMESLGSLAGGVAHDFNNLLTGVLGYAELAQMRVDPGSAVRADLDEICKAAQRGAALTKQLLSFARKDVVQTQIVDLNELSRGIESLLRQLLGADIELATSLDPELGKVMVDPAQMEQVLMNLAVNARDAMPRGGSLVVETHNVTISEPQQTHGNELAPGEYVQICISDNGWGMSKEVQAQAFDPFYTTKEKGKGTGLGLSTCYGIIQNNGGHIWLYSEPEMGTSFRIYFPRADGVPVANVTIATPVAASKGETILVVEDEESILSLMVTVLTEAGYRVLHAPDGKTALELAFDFADAIHMVVTDVIMPGLKGRELVEALTVMRPQLKVLYISGFTDDAMVHQGVLAQNMAFLQKPFAPRNLLQKVREFIDNGHA